MSWAAGRGDGDTGGHLEDEDVSVDGEPVIPTLAWLNLAVSEPVPCQTAVSALKMLPVSQESLCQYMLDEFGGKEIGSQVLLGCDKRGETSNAHKHFRKTVGDIAKPSAQRSP